MPVISINYYHMNLGNPLNTEHHIQGAGAQVQIKAKPILRDKSKQTKQRAGVNYTSMK